ncbi:tRNA-binding protein CsaA-like protein [Psychroflexus torquis ATCC 700755]|uniref:tRNA-binding protein CsaA-like protein n=1 Tax=Psychroflexus torquis (strain ATCC 700755 / CIP 106069 / ACAM 623) TaxID=313595 RepID=K4IGY1_PSYTT|nr:tRNA-binding protein [Psychroflexus torquis]AFU69609.1 tRNA-binding protein CsaA-like protein [Psychroflexus torquis ATCC 700755]
MDTFEHNLSWSDFQKVEMRVGTILKAEPFKQAKKPAIQLEIDFGDIGIKRSSAQITELYDLEELIGKQVIAVLNFPPKQIATMMSECLILAAVDSDVGTSLLSPDHRLKNGTRIS